MLGALLPLSSAHAQGVPILLDAVTTQEITAPLNTATMDDYLLDMARLTQVNVIADATDFPVQSAAKVYPSSPASIAGQTGEHRDKWTPILINVMGDFTAQYELSTLRCDTRTFLFWSEPEPHQLLALQVAVTEAVEAARFAEAAAAGRAAGVPEEELIQGELPESRLQRVLQDYLQKEHGWTGSVRERSDQVDIRTRLSDLSPGLRALVLLELRHRLSGQIGFGEGVAQGNDELRLRAERTGVTTALSVSHRTRYGDGTEHELGYPFTKINDAAVGEAAIPPVPQADPIAATLEKPLVPAQANAQDSWLKAYSGVSDDAFDPSLDADGALQRVVSLQVKRLALHDLLAQLQQQSGVRLALGEDAPAAKLVTARVEKMPLSKLMGVLSRVYGVKWSKGAGNTYTIRGNDQGELHLKLLQMGDSERYRFRFSLQNRADRENEKVALGRAVVQQVGLAALQTPEGVDIAALPQPLQQQMRRAYKIDVVEWQTGALYRANQVLIDQLSKNGLVLRFGNSVSKTYRSPFFGFGGEESEGRLRFNVQSDDGQVIVPVFDSFMLRAAQPGEQNVRPPSRRR